MKKKIKDLTLTDLHKICVPFSPCARCPLYRGYYGLCVKNDRWAFEEFKNEEIEIKD